MTRRMTPESSLLKAAKDYLSLRGCLVFRANSGVLAGANGRPVRFGTPGHPDLYGVLPRHNPPHFSPFVPYPSGRAFFIELKAGKNKPTARQAAVLAELELRGAAVAVIRSIDELQQWLDGLGI